MVKACSSSLLCIAASESARHSCSFVATGKGYRAQRHCGWEYRQGLAGSHMEKKRSFPFSNIDWFVRYRSCMTSIDHCYRSILSYPAGPLDCGILPKGISSFDSTQPPASPFSSSPASAGGCVSSYNVFPRPASSTQIVRFPLPRPAFRGFCRAVSSPLEP